LTLQALLDNNAHGQNSQGQAAEIWLHGHQVESHNQGYYIDDDLSGLVELQPLPLSPLLMCPFVTFEQPEFRMDGAGHNCTVTFPRYLHINMTPVSFDVLALGAHSGQWSVSQDGKKLSMCVDLYNAIFPQQVVLKENSVQETPLTRQVVSAVCGGVSVLCLLLTLVTYSLFSSLRALPGLNNMGLSASLGLAQLSLLVPWHRTGSATVCQLVGMLTHWL
jgi:hypothetical protein